MVVRVALDVSAAPVRLAGAGRYVAELARHLDGVDLELVTRRDDEDRWRVPGTTVTGLVSTPRPLRLLEEAFWLGWSPPARRSDVWHSPHYTMPYLTRTPVVVTIHDMTFFTHPEWHEPAKVRFFRSAISRAARRASAVVCVSETTADEFRELRPRGRVIVAPHGVDLTRFSPEGVDDASRLHDAGLDGVGLVVLFVGTLEPRKGVDTLVSAFARVMSRQPDAELWLVGQEGWGVHVDELCQRAGVSSRVRRMGFVPDDLRGPLLRRATVVAYPSRGEGFGLPVLEALACGATVVTTRATVIEEVAGGCATLVTPGDVEELAQALEMTLDGAGADPASRARGVARAREFTWEESARRHLVAYEAART